MINVLSSTASRYGNILSAICKAYLKFGVNKFSPVTAIDSELMSLLDYTRQNLSKTILWFYPCSGHGVRENRAYRFMQEVP
jgi:hypothetical protein